MLGNYRVAAQLVASRVVLSSIELVSLWVYTAQVAGFSEHSLEIPEEQLKD
jgi:hypothetical protein